MRHPIPAAALDDRLFFAGTAGSGKTYNAGSGVERLLSAKARVVVIDPLGVWWGLRLSADGKDRGFDIAIFGGPHGDLPLTEHAGALIGEAAASMAESCVLDLSQIGTKAGERRFMLAFLTALYKHSSGEPVHVVFDEADMWAPQQIRDKDGEAAKLYGMMETIVRRGRVRGFIPWLISQRPAVLSKDVLSQVDGLIAFKLTSSQDRDAIGDWVQGQADKAQWREIWAQLPTMAQGQGVVWVPARGILDTVQFPVKATFDSSRTPKRGEKQKRTAALKPLDLGRLKDRLASVEAESKANDPRALRAEVVRLKSEMQKLSVQKTGDNRPDPAAIEKAEQRGFERAKKQLTAAAERQVREAHLNILQVLRGRLAPLDALLDEEIRRARATKAELAKAVEYAPAPAAPRPMAVPRPASSVLPQTPSRAKPITPSGDGSYTRPQVKVLESLAMWKALGHDTPSREMVAAVAGYSPTSGGFANLLGSLKTPGAIDYPAPGQVTLCVDGIDVPSQDEGRDLLLSTLSNPQRKIVAALIDQGARSRADIGLDTEYSPTSGGFANLLGSLRTLGVIDYPQSGAVALSDWAQELLTGHAERVAA